MKGILIKNFTRDIFYSILDAWSKRKGNRFIIFAQGRSGSTALQDLLNGHSSIRCEGELLMKRHIFPISFLEGKAYRYTRRGMTWGCKLKWWHLTKYQDRRVRPFLIRLVENGWKIIYLHRENLLFQALSTLAGQEREKRSLDEKNKWQYKGEENLDTPRIDVSKIEEYVESRKSQTRKEEKALNGLTHKKLIYERDLYETSAHQRTLELLCDFLELPRAEANVSYKKSGGGVLQKYVSNDQEVRSKIKSLGLAHYLNDERYVENQ